MKVSLNWLKELVNIDVDVKALTDAMSLHSIEIENYEQLVNATNLIIGEVLECVNHPNSDHLHVCQVNLGALVKQIVCGAPNVKAGQKVIVALPGAKLPGGEIKESVIRGVSSYGMICSLQELGIESKYIPVEYASGIYVLDNDAIVGFDALDYLMYHDYVIELGLTPNRMDLLSLLGVARDVNAIYNLGLNPLDYKFKESKKETKTEIDVELKTTTCYSYYARKVEGLVIKESPQFIKTRLMASGIRPINNVVDITNYVLMLFGQPLHAFDAGKLGSKIVVRRARDGETTTTLDDNERVLNHHDIVITDNYETDNENTRVVCIAGVMGCKNTEVTSDTKAVVLESAVFRPLSIRKTSSRLGLRSESSIRFERGVDLTQSEQAVDYACYLLTKYASGKVLKGTIHQGLSNIEPKPFKLTEKYIKDYLGIKVSLQEMEDIFHRLGFEANIQDKEIIVKVPNRRLDITIKEDLVEEVARIKGYDALNETTPVMDVSGALTIEQRRRKAITNTLVGLGLNEVITYSLLSEKEANEFKVLFNDQNEAIKLIYPISEERSILRRTLLSSLVEVATYNNARKISDLQIFEIGKRYYHENEDNTEQWCVAGYLNGQVASTLWKNEIESVDFYYVKGILNELFALLGVTVEYKVLDEKHPELHPSRSAWIMYQDHPIGFIGKLHPQYIKDHDLAGGYVFEIIIDELLTKSQTIKMYKQISKVPAVERDLALVMKKEQPVGEIIEAIYRSDKECIKSVEVFDIYVGDKIDASLKSVAVRIRLEANETLTEEVINSKIKRLLNGLKYRYNIELRS